MRKLIPLFLLLCGGAAPPPSTVAPSASSGAPVAACPPTVDALPESPLVDAADPRLKGDHLVVVFKARRRLGHYSGGTLREGGCVEVGLAAGYPAGHKLRQGDRRTPEGWYTTSDKPWSQWYHAIAIHYPNEADADAALAAGRIDRATRDAISGAIRRGEKPPQSTSLGGEILFHGGGASDWTLGCVALDDGDIDALRAALPSDLKVNVLLLP